MIWKMKNFRLSMDLKIVYLWEYSRGNVRLYFSEIYESVKFLYQE